MFQGISLRQGFVSSNWFIGFGRILLSQLLALLASDTMSLLQQPTEEMS